MWGVLADVLSRFAPVQRDLLHLSFALADASRLEDMLANAGFRDVRVERVQRPGKRVALGVARTLPAPYPPDKMICPALSVRRGQVCSGLPPGGRTIRTIGPP
jgi:hypothetical protein